MLQRRDRAKVAALIISMIVCPLAISYVYANVSGWSTQSVVDYNITDATSGSGYNSYWKIENATDDYASAALAIVLTNSTYTISMAALPHAAAATIGTQTNAWIVFKLNFTQFASTTISSIKIDWVYVGTGNITSLRFDSTLPVSLNRYVTTTDVDESAGTCTYTPTAFEAVALKTFTIIQIRPMFDDASFQPGVTDIIELSMTVYESTMILTQTQLLQLLAGGAGIMFIIAGVAISPLWNPTKKSYSRR